MFLVIATIPGAIAGLALESYADNAFRDPRLIALLLIVMGVLLWWVDKAAAQDRPLAAMRWTDALLIGLAQMFAILPGVSRSGSTITAGRGLRLTRESAAVFSFLMSMPIIAAASLVKIPHVLKTEGSERSARRRRAGVGGERMVGDLRPAQVCRETELRGVRRLSGHRRTDRPDHCLQPLRSSPRGWPRRTAASPPTNSPSDSRCLSSSHSTSSSRRSTSRMHAPRLALRRGRSFSPMHRPLAADGWDGAGSRKPGRESGSRSSSGRGTAARWACSRCASGWHWRRRLNHSPARQCNSNGRTTCTSAAASWPACWSKRAGRRI